jgi:hypothetical protein
VGVEPGRGVKTCSSSKAGCCGHEFAVNAKQILSERKVKMLESMNRSTVQESQEHSEGMLARAMEDQTAKLPSDVWLWAALGSMGVSFLLHASGRKQDSFFVGQWAAPFLLLGLYNKLVKIGGSDRVHQ